MVHAHCERLFCKKDVKRIHLVNLFRLSFEYQRCDQTSLYVRCIFLRHGFNVFNKLPQRDILKEIEVAKLYVFPVFFNRFGSKKTRTDPITNLEYWQP
jgi:hypothetical protein